MYHVLTDAGIDDTYTGPVEPAEVKPPPIFVYGVTTLPGMQKRLNELDGKQYTTKSMANDAIKLT
jgi:hypothetical protein